MTSEAAVRLAAFFGVFGVMALWETMAPWRHPQPRQRRWPGNIGVVVIGTLLVRLVLPMTAVAVAMLAEARGWGLFNLLAVPKLASVILSVILLDLAIYAQHVAFHHVPVLWRLHRMHHADTTIDVTTGLRFHPFEFLLSMLIKWGVVVALGVPAVAVVIFEVLLNATSMFNHANIVLPKPVDRLIRLFVVTPAMHRVHHSTIRAETDSNFGFNLSCWDRLFRTYRADARRGEGMEIGLHHFREAGEQRLDRLLTQPFRSEEPADQPQNLP